MLLCIHAYTGAVMYKPCYVSYCVVVSHANSLCNPHILLYEGYPWYLIYEGYEASPHIWYISYKACIASLRAKILTSLPDTHTHTHIRYEGYIASSRGKQPPVGDITTPVYIYISYEEHEYMRTRAREGARARLHAWWWVLPSVDISRRTTRALFFFWKKNHV